MIAWLQTLPLDLGTIDAKVAAALRAEQLVRLNNLRQLAAHGQAPGRARLDRGLPRLRRAARGLRRARGDPARGARALPGRRPHPRRATPPATARRPWTPSRSEDGPQLIVCSMKAASQGHHAHPRLERGVPRARLDARPPRPGGGPPPPDRPGGGGDGVLPAGARHDRRDDGRAAPAQAQPDQRRHRRPGARRGAPRGRRRARAARPARCGTCASSPRPQRVSPRVQRTASGASRTIAITRRLWTATMNVVFAPAPKATARTA